MDKNLNGDSQPVLVSPSAAFPFDQKGRKSPEDSVAVVSN